MLLLKTNKNFNALPQFMFLNSLSRTDQLNQHSTDQSHYNAGTKPTQGYQVYQKTA